jgi:diguanylate cyclase (GGDEF)-like protein
MFAKLAWIIIFAGILYFIFSEIVFSEKPVFQDLSLLTHAFLRLPFFIFVLLLHFFKGIMFEKGLLANSTLFFTVNLAWLFTLSFAIIIMDFGIWPYALILLAILVTSLTKGTKTGLVIVGSSFVFHTALTLAAIHFNTGGTGAASPDLLRIALYIIFMYAALVFFALFCGMIYKDDIESEIENKSLMEQLEEKYLQLENAQEEIKNQYDRLKGTNSKLEETNKKLSESIAEFYTLQQISQAISSILDIKELLKYLNDIILGVMGVNYSTIILYDEKTGRLKVHTSNIVNIGEMATMIDNINCSVLFEAMNRGQHIIENFADPEKYAFISGREVNSLICIPLNTKSRKFGLVLVEHKLSNAFDDENVRLLNIIAKQVGIAMENAELYQRMQELASRDGLTGVYNRQYFQTRLDMELKAAQKENYPLSLAIYDIDHFKRFNDTFGHLFGDKVLKAIVDAVSASLRKNDIIARFGGEEFIILFPRTGLNEAYEKVESLRRMISKHVIKDNLVAASVTVSFGVSCYDECALSEADLLRTADDALYEAKAAGRNCIKVARRLSE